MYICNIEIKTKRNMDIKELKKRIVRVSTYATYKGKSVVTIKNWGLAGDIQVEKFDGINYVVLKDDELQFFNK